MVTEYPFGPKLRKLVAYRKNLTCFPVRTRMIQAEDREMARVPNIPALLKNLKKRGLWVFGAAAEGAVPLYEADLRVPAAVVIGSEGDGMGRLVRESCDLLVSIPMRGRISSLNASAAAVLLYEALRQRR